MYLIKVNVASETFISFSRFQTDTYLVDLLMKQSQAHFKVGPFQIVVTDVEIIVVVVAAIATAIATAATQSVVAIEVIEAVSTLVVTML